MNILQKNFPAVCMFLYGAVVVFLAFTLPLMHDYTEYVKQWEHFLQMGKPYLDFQGNFNGNAYGLFHSLFAYLYALYPTIPRVVFVLSWIGVSLLVLSRFRGVLRLWWGMVALLFFNPFFFVLFVMYGHNEIIAVFFTVLAVFLLQGKKDTWAGVALAIAILVKIVPIVLVPFLFFGEKKLRWRFLSSVCVSLFFVMLLAWSIWGNEIWTPFTFAAGRESKLLSIFYFLRAEFSPLRLFKWLPNVDWLSLPLMVGSLAILCLIQLRYRLDVITVTLLAFLTIFLFYKVNHHQYHTATILLSVYWISCYWKKIVTYNVQVGYVLVFILWISINVLLYAVLGNFYGEWEWIRSGVGLPTFILNILAFVPLWQYIQHDRNT